MRSRASATTSASFSRADSAASSARRLPRSPPLRRGHRGVVKGSLAQGFTDDFVGADADQAGYHRPGRLSQ